MPLRMAIVLKDKRHQVLARVWRKGNPLHCYWECKLVRLLWKSFLQKLKIELPYDPAVTLLGVY